MRFVRHLPLALVVGCACVLDDTPAGVRHEGAPALGAERVVEAASRRCPEDLRGSVRWTDEVFACGEVAHANGCASLGLCHLSVTVRRLEPATSSALAHEIGHYCLATDDEAEADAFAEGVNRAASW